MVARDDVGWGSMQLLTVKPGFVNSVLVGHLQTARNWSTKTCTNQCKPNRNSCSRQHRPTSTFKKCTQDASSMNEQEWSKNMAVATRRKLFCTNQIHHGFSHRIYPVYSWIFPPFLWRQGSAVRFQPAEGKVGSAARTWDMSATTFLIIAAVTWPPVMAGFLIGIRRG